MKKDSLPGKAPGATWPERAKRTAGCPSDISLKSSFLSEAAESSPHHHRPLPAGSIWATFLFG